MLGQPASSQTVCRPSRRTSDFSSVYSGPVLSRVLIHSGLRSIGTWLLRTSRRRSLRPDGSIGAPEEGVGSTVSLMIPTVPADADAPEALRQRGRRTGGVRRSDLLVVRPCGRALVRTGAGAERLRRGVGRVGARVRTVAVGELGVAHAHIRFRGCGIAGRLHCAGDRLAGVAVGSGHGVLSVAGHRTVTG